MSDRAPPTVAPAAQDAPPPAPPPPSAQEVPPPAAQAAPAEEQVSLEHVLASANAWALALFNQHLDPASRLAVARASKGCWQCALEVAEQATVTLLAHGALADAAWQARLAAAGRVLAARGPPPDSSADGECLRGTTLVLRIPTPHPSALQAALSLPSLAGRAVTALKVLHYKYPVVLECAPWPQPPAPVFSSVRSLTVKHLSSPLPPPDQLPNLRELVVHLSIEPRRDGPDPVFARLTEVRCASVGRYLSQITALSVYEEHDLGQIVPWSFILSTRSDTLTTLVTDTTRQDLMLPLLPRVCPRLQRLSCFTCALGSGVSQTSWELKEYSMESTWGEAKASDLATWPSTPGGLQIKPRADGVVRIAFEIAGRQGLSEAVLRRLQPWRFTAPCDAHLCVLPAQMPIRRIQAGAAAALRQLSVLPAGSRITCNPLLRIEQWGECFAPTSAAIAAVAPTIPHITIIHPDAPDSAFVRLLSQQPPPTHASLCCYKLSGAYAHVPWPWQTLSASLFSCESLLHLPDPRNGHYEIGVPSFSLQTEEWTQEMFAELAERLQHWTFVVTGPYDMQFTLQAPEGPDTQPAALQKHLHLLSTCSWRFESPDTAVIVSLPADWVLSMALMSELSGLPTLGRQGCLRFYKSIWLPDCSKYEQLASLVPTHYSTWHVGSGPGFTVEHLVALCMGAQARGEGCERLLLRVWHLLAGFTDEQRSQVEACIDERGLGRWVQVEWYP